MTAQEAIEQIKMILEEVTSYEHAVCYVTSCNEEPLRLAIKALEKQIPKKIVNIDKFSDYAECPSCGGIATDELGCLYKWCRKCGQKLKWGEEDD